MTDEVNLIQTYQHYIGLRAAGEDTEAEEYLKNAVQNMSVEERNRLMMELATMAFEEAVEERDTIADMQEKTIKTYDELEKLKEKLQKE